MTKRVLAATMAFLLVAAGAPGFAKALTHPKGRFKKDPLTGMLGERAQEQKLRIVVRGCGIEEGELVYSYHYNEELVVKKAMRLTLDEDERIVDFGCWDNLTGVLTNKAIHLIPSLSEVENDENERKEAVRVTFEGMDNVLLSDSDPLILFRKQDKIEAYRVTPKGLENILSYRILFPIKRIVLNDITKSIFIVCEGKTFKFDYDGKEK